MEQLPTELLSRIISKVNEAQDVKNLCACSLVSRFWNSVTNPFLFICIGVDLAPRDAHVAPARAANPSLRNVQTLLTLYTFLSMQPELASHVCMLKLRIALPCPPSKRSDPVRNNLDASYGVDPTSLVAILECLPNARVIKFHHVFLSRSLQVGDPIIYTQFLFLTFNFVECPLRWGFDGLDMLEVLTLFPECLSLHVKSVVAGPGADAHTPTPQLRLKNPRTICSRLGFGDTIAPEHAFSLLQPSRSALTDLLIDFASHATLLWLALTLREFSQTLEYLDISVASDTVAESNGGDYPIYDFLVSTKWTNLRHVSVKFVKQTADIARRWAALLHFARTLQPSVVPSLEHLLLCGGHVEAAPQQPVLHRLSLNFQQAEDVLLRLSEEAVFTRLDICIILPTNANLSFEFVDTNVPLGSESFFNDIFPRLRASRILRVRPFSLEAVHGGLVSLVEDSIMERTFTLMQRAGWI